LSVRVPSRPEPNVGSKISALNELVDGAFGVDGWLAGCDKHAPA
jgi:hypothetical protein